MPYYRKYIYSGPVLEMHEYYAIRPPGIKNRSHNVNISSDWQKDINLKNTKKQVDRLVNTNFTRKDYFLTYICQRHNGRSGRKRTYKLLQANKLPMQKT